MSATVAVALASLGGGHRSVSRAISQALREASPAVNVTEVDVFSRQCSAFPLTAIPRLYTLFTADAPFVWSALYNSTNGRSRFRFVERLAQPMIRRKLKEALASIKPSVIVSVFPALGYTLQCALRELGWHTPLGVVVIDLISIHDAWLCRDAAWHAVPTEGAQQALLSGGIEGDSIHVTGLPVGEGFARKPTGRISAQQQLGLPQDRPVVLLVAGGTGARYLRTLASKLASSGLPCSLVVVAGRNERLRRRLVDDVQGLPCRVLGYVTDMSRLMWASDVIVTKAGPSTITEAVNCGLPMVLTGAIPGQEEGNVRYVVSNGIGMLAAEPAEVVRSVAKLLGDQGMVAKMRSAMRSLRRPTAAHEVAQLILGSC